MEIEQLITNIDKLKSKSDEINQNIVAKMSTLNKLNSEIDKEKQRLEAEVEELAKLIENKLKESEKIDLELSDRSSLLSRMQKSRNLIAQKRAQSSRDELSHNPSGASIQANGSKTKSIVANSKNLKGNSLEDFLRIQFEQEFQVKYPSVPEQYLDERDFVRVLSILRTRMQDSQEPHKVVDEYLSNYPQSIDSQQVDRLKKLQAENGASGTL